MVNVNLPPFFLVSILLILGAVKPAMAEVEVSVDRNPVQVNEAFQLVFSLDQSPDHEPDFSALQQHFMVLGNSRSNSISIINGEYQRSVKWTLQLMPKQIGEFTIPAIRFDHERSKPIQVTVKPSSLSALPQDRLVLEMQVDKPEAYVQSQVILTLRLLSATSISAYHLGGISLENLDAVIEPLGDERQYQTRIADRSYLVLEKQYALFPQQSGRLGIAPVMAEVRLPSGSSFDPFRTGGKIHRLRSQQLFVDVKPIPAEFAGPDWLPANKVELREQWQGDINSLVAGEPVTRSLILSADGLTSAQLPELKLAQVDGIKQYPDQPVLENSRGSNGINGKREQKVALIPGAEGRYLLPEIRLPWWNLQTGKLETATIPAREIIVNAAANAIVAAPSGESGQPSEVTPQVLETSNYWIWISLLLAAGWSMSLLYWRLNSKPSPKRNTLPVEARGVREARKQLQQACDANDGVAARPALLNWGRALLAPREVDNLHQLGRLMGADLAREIEVLNQSLYAEARAQWQGRGLWSLCQQLEQSTRSGRNQVGPELSPLNP